MTDPLEQRIIDVIQDALRHSSERQDVVVTAEDSMETVTGWDSLSFMSIFSAINTTFGLDPDFDDAIHYTSVKALYTYVKERAA